MKNVFLIDFENVSDSGLEGFFDLSREDEVRLFYTSNAGKISIDFIRSMLSAEKCADIRFEKVSNGKQALDLQIATYLGSILENEANYFIISKDKEYAHIIDFWKVRKPDRNIALKKSIAEGFAQSPTVAEMPESPVLSEQKPVEKKVVVKPQKPKQTAVKKTYSSAEKNDLNTKVQQALSKAGMDNKIISGTASIVSKKCNEEGAKKTIYNEIIKQYGQKKGLDIYNHIKDILK